MRIACKSLRVQRAHSGGRNGYGAKLCNVFSTKFTVETSSKKYGKALKQTWTNNMHKTDGPKVREKFLL